MEAEIGIIGGTSSFPAELLESRREAKVHTPYGAPSDLITLGEFKGRKVALLNRHGRSHTIPPHRINFRANIFALKSLGCERILATAAAGSLREDVRPGDIVIIDQFIDFGKTVHTFYDEGKFFHIGLAHPFCESLRELLVRTGRDLGLRMHEKGTYLKIDGPQLSTRAASLMYKNHADLIGMTVAPEAALAREKEMCFSTIATITDYDSWIGMHATLEEIKQVMAKNAENVRNLLTRALEGAPQQRTCSCSSALAGAEA